MTRPIPVPDVLKDADLLIRCLWVMYGAGDRPLTATDIRIEGGLYSLWESVNQVTGALFRAHERDYVRRSDSRPFRYLLTDAGAAALHAFLRNAATAPGQRADPDPEPIEPADEMHVEHIEAAPAPEEKRCPPRCLLASFVLSGMSMRSDGTLTLRSDDRAFDLHRDDVRELYDFISPWANAGRL